MAPVARAPRQRMKILTLEAGPDSPGSLLGGGPANEVRKALVEKPGDSPRPSWRFSGLEDASVLAMARMA